jgi:glycosyltransferase involved in cell wall biosynthesis
MRIGICAYWFNRGQGVVARQIRSALDRLGHETFVLARPTRAKNIRPAFVDRSGVWDQPRITEASHYRIPRAELLAWGEENDLELALFDQNYGFREIAALRATGVRTVGRFVWEQFEPGHVAAAREAFDVIYSLTDAERRRYAELGVTSPRVRWGIHPELLAYTKPLPEPGTAARLFFYPAGFLSRRKPLPQLLKAFRRVEGDDVRLLVKGQVEREEELLADGQRRDRRIEVVLEDLPLDAHMRLFASADVCVAPSRWEGLGLHLYEAMALGLPVITNEAPPMDEVIVDRENGLLVRSRRRGKATSGIPAQLPSVRDLARAMDELRDPETYAVLCAGTAAARERLAWDHTVGDLAELVGSGMIPGGERNEEEETR